jgi:hypothetical protein
MLARIWLENFQKVKAGLLELQGRKLMEKQAA